MKKSFFFVQILAVKNFENSLKSAGEIFLSGLRGAKKNSNTFRILFRRFFCVFQTLFRIDLNIFRGGFVLQYKPPKYDCSKAFFL